MSKNLHISKNSYNFAQILGKMKKKFYWKYRKQGHRRGCSESVVYDFGLPAI